MCVCCVKEEGRERVCVFNHGFLCEKRGVCVCEQDVCVYFCEVVCVRNGGLVCVCVWLSVL